MSKNDIKLTPELLSKLQEVKGNEKDLTDETKEAIKSLELANKIINSISNGKQIDMAFFKKIQEVMTKNLEKNISLENNIPKKVKKVKKVYK